MDLVLRWKQSRSIDFTLQRFEDKTDKPIETKWSIRVWHPDRRIEKCKVFFDDIPLPWWDPIDRPVYERFFHEGGGGNVRIPKDLENDSIVVVKDGNKILRKERFKDIPMGTP